jgi:hypothetical protein
MVEQFVMRFDKDGRKLTKQIRDRAEVCYVADCWPLKDPNDRGSIYLSKKFLVSSSSEAIQKKRRVQIRHILFQIAYGEVLPIGRLTRMRCHNNRCINPAHIKVANWNPSYAAIRKMLNQGWITEEQADEWFAGITEPPTNNRLTDESRDNDSKSKEHQKWEAIYHAHTKTA